MKRVLAGILIILMISISVPYNTKASEATQEAFQILSIVRGANDMVERNKRERFRQEQIKQQELERRMREHARIQKELQKYGEPGPQCFQDYQTGRTFCLTE